MIGNGELGDTPVVMVRPRRHLMKHSVHIIRLGKAEIALGILMCILTLLRLFIGAGYGVDIVITRLFVGLTVMATGFVAAFLNHRCAGIHLYRSNLGLPIVGALFALLSVAVSVRKVTVLVLSRNVLALGLNVMLAVTGLAAAISCLLHATLCCSECCCCEAEDDPEMITLDLNGSTDQIVPTTHA